MGKLDALKVKRAPKAFVPTFRKLNRAIELLSSIQGGPGIDVQLAPPMAPRPLSPGQPRPKEQPRGRIVLSLRPAAVSGLGVGGGGTTNSVNTNAVGVDGSLSVLTVQSAAIGTNNYPTTLRTNGNSNYGVTNASGWYLVGPGGNSVTIPFANISRPITLRTINICDNGNTRSIDILASAPY